MFLLINSLLFQKAPLAIATLAFKSISLLASSVIQLPRYLNRVTCSKGTLSNIIHCCIPFDFSALFIIITLVFLTFISIPYALHVSLNLSIVFCIFFILSATNTASLAYLKSVTFIPLKATPSIHFIDSIYAWFPYHKLTL